MVNFVPQGAGVNPINSAELEALSSRLHQFFRDLLGGGWGNSFEEKWSGRWVRPCNWAIGASEGGKGNLKTASPLKLFRWPAPQERCRRPNRGPVGGAAVPFFDRQA